MEEGHDKPDWALLHVDPVIDVIRVLMFGEKRYGRDNMRFVVFFLLWFR